MVVLTGDLVSGYAWKNQQNFFYDSWKSITDILEEYKIPYAYAFGNHDYQGDLDIHAMAELDQSNSHSLLQRN